MQQRRSGVKEAGAGRRRKNTDSIPSDGAVKQTGGIKYEGITCKRQSPFGRMCLYGAF